MLDLPSPDLPEQHFQLQERPRNLRLGEPIPKISDAGSISISSPFSVAIDEKLIDGDAELEAFWKAERNVARYDYVTFRCSFRPGADARLDRVWVKVNLTASSGQATAWSMSPKSIVDTKELTRTAKLSGDAKLFDVKLFSAELSGAEKATQKEAFLLAQREHTTEPYWEFRASSATKIEGTFALHLGVRADQKAQVAGSIDVEATALRRTFILFSESKSIGDVPRVTFKLGAGG